MSSKRQRSPRSRFGIKQKQKLQERQQRKQSPRWLAGIQRAQDHWAAKWKSCEARRNSNSRKDHQCSSRSRDERDNVHSPLLAALRAPLSGQPEQVLYHRLIAALPECIVLAEVQLSRVLGVKRGSRFNEWNNRINRLSLDFLVCSKDSTVVAAIELGDRTHERDARREADARKEKALGAAGIPLLRWSVRALPDEAVIRQVIAK